MVMGVYHISSPEIAYYKTQEQKLCAVHNIIKIHSSVMWDSQYSTNSLEYYPHSI